MGNFSCFNVSSDFFNLSFSKKSFTYMYHKSVKQFGSRSYQTWPASTLFCLVWCLTSQSTAMVMSGQSVYLTTLFPGQAWLQVSGNQYFVHILLLVTDNNPSWIRGREENGHRQSPRKMGPDRNQTCDPWISSQTCICSQTRYPLRYQVKQQKTKTATSG